MTQPVDDNQTTAESPIRRRNAAAVLGLVTAGVLILGSVYYAYTTRSAMESRVTDLNQQFDARLADEIEGMRQHTASLTTDIAAVRDRVDGATREAKAATELGRTLKRAQDRTARMVTAQTADIKAVQDGAATQAADTASKIAGVSAEVSRVASGLADARNDAGEIRLQMAAMKAEVSNQIAGNTKAVAELRRLGARESFEFDVSKSSASAASKVGDVRIQLTKTDVRKAKYDLVLHVDDRQVERKDLTIGEPVQFLAGPERRRHELVVTDMERDRIRGYLSVSTVGAVQTSQVAAR
jgi:chromosome segregation ATPase